MKNLFRKLFFSLTIILFNSIVADAGSYPDYTREKNIHNQITSYIFDSDIVELSSKLEQMCVFLQYLARFEGSEI